MTTKQQSLNADFQATKGLLSFACFLAILSWLLMSAVYGGNATILSIQKIFTVIGVLMGSGCFFCLVAVATFAGAGIKDVFCTVLDPDTLQNSTYCGYSDGFGAAVAGIVLSALQTALFFFWMPHTGGEAMEEGDKGGSWAASSGGTAGYAGFGGAGPSAPEGGDAGAAFSGGFNSASADSTL